MSDIAIRVENLSKQYRIGGLQIRYRTIRESITDTLADRVAGPHGAVISTLLAIGW